MSNYNVPRYYHLPLKTMEIIRPEPPEVTLATQRIFNLIELEEQRRIAHPQLATALTVLTRNELIQFKNDDLVVAKRYDMFLAWRAQCRTLLTSHARLQHARLRGQHLDRPGPS